MPQSPMGYSIDQEIAWLPEPSSAFAGQPVPGLWLAPADVPQNSRLLVGASRRVSFSSASVKGLSPFKQALGTREVDAGLYHTKSSRAAVIAQEFLADGFTIMFGIGAIHAFYGDREHAIFGSSYPAFFFQIPEMKLQTLGRTA